MNTWTTPAGSAPALFYDILNQPHALIAGTTGSGKSVLLNGVIWTALYFAPNEKQFIFIDTKKTELHQYKALPHTLAYYNDADAAVQGLASVLELTRQRCEDAARQGRKQSAAPDLYVIVDELGDLVFSNRRASYILGQIAMIGRAANVHLIAGTQCPNRKTLSAEFAANMPARVGLRCRDRIESRQIIGTPDAVSLPLYGECFYLSPAKREPELYTVPYITDAEQIDRVRWWTDQAAAQAPQLPPKKPRFSIFRR